MTRGLAALLLVGCGSSQPPPAPPRTDDTRSLRDAYCACTDKACLDAVDARAQIWWAQHRHEVVGRTPSPDDDRISAETGACRDKLVAATTPKPPPVPPEAHAQQAAAVDRFADAICACTDHACLQKVYADMSTALGELSKKQTGDWGQPTPAEVAAASHLTDCITKAAKAASTP